jgi:hypothetical protein
MIRHSTYTIEEVLPFVIDEPRKDHQYRLKKEDKATWSERYKEAVSRVYKGLPVKTDSLRYQVFKTHGTQCVCCGLQGKFFALEAHEVDAERGVFHFNLYGVKDGEEVLITKDHIRPKSKGGADVLSNMQTMCAPCNETKGNK